MIFQFVIFSIIYFYTIIFQKSQNLFKTQVYKYFIANRTIANSKDGETERITLSVLGDVNGDGRISASDVTYLRQIASDNALYESLSVEKKLASMVINKGNVTSADAEIVKNVINKMFGIDIFF